MKSNNTQILKREEKNLQQRKPISIQTNKEYAP